MADQLIRTGRATHPGIGILAVTSTAEMAIATTLVRGALVERVVPSLGAAQAGIRPGDVITNPAGTRVNSLDQMLVAIRGHKTQAPQKAEVGPPRQGHAPRV